MTLRSAVLLTAIAGLFGWIGSLFGTVGAAIALSASIVLSFWSYWSAGPDFLLRTGARPCKSRSIVRLTEELASRADIPSPRVYIVADDQPNALALGPRPDMSILVLTTALVSELNRDELAAVIAHELAHIRNRDVLASMLASTFVGAILSLCALLGLFGLSLRRNGGAAIIALAFFAPLVAVLLHLAMCRSIEYRADRNAAQLCGNPCHLISALRRLACLTDRTTCAAAMVNPSFASLFFLDPFEGTWLGAFFSAHPQITRRIARLEAMRPYIGTARWCARFRCGPPDEEETAFGACPTPRRFGLAFRLFSQRKR